MGGRPLLPDKVPVDHVKDRAPGADLGAESPSVLKCTLEHFPQCCGARTTMRKLCAVAAKRINVKTRRYAS
jgi:hypothetical protein